MTDVIDNRLSLYFTLNPGASANLEHISRAAIEWVESVRLAAKSIDPTLEVQIKFIDADEASLSINTALEWGEGQLRKIEEKFPYPRVALLASSLALFLIVDAGPTRDYWFGEPDTIELSEEDRRRFDELLADISNSEDVAKANRRFFAAASHDPAISSVGICERPGTPPVISVPSSQFAERAGLWELQEEDHTRTNFRVSDVFLETANLSEIDRKWRFRDKATNVAFTAKMKDEAFLLSLRHGESEERLRIGIEMQIHIRFKERFEDGEWVSIPSTIEVLHVLFEK